MTTDSNNDIGRLQDWIGREETANDHLSPTLVERFNATFDLGSSLTLGEVAPPLIHFCLCHSPAPTSQLGHDGHPPRGGFLPPTPLPRRMWVGGEVTWISDLRIGDVVERRSVITEITQKSGRTGDLIFVTIQHEFKSNGTTALLERQDLVFRPSVTRTTPKEMGVPPATVGNETRLIAASPPFLFRYSALTFNGHRIHYDDPYAREEEAYPGLIVHGPLQATLLALFAAESKNHNPTNFTFRSMSPISNRGNFSINARWQGEELELWTAAEGGPVAMKATARW